MSLVKASEADFDLPPIGWFDDGARTFSYDDDLLRCPSVTDVGEAAERVESAIVLTLCIPSRRSQPTGEC